jgi:CBS domain-containing protein
MLKEETINFLIKIQPFEKLSDEELNDIADDIVLEYYPSGMRILSQDGPPSDYLRLIKKGAVKVYLSSEEEEEIILDYRSEGEQFGLVSAISGDRSRANVVAVEDTICYLIAKEKITALFQSNPAVNEHFMRSFFINFIDKTYDETKRRYTGFGDADRKLFTTPVGNIITRNPVTASHDVSVREAAKVMSANTVSSIILLDDAGDPVGIITDRDLRDKVVSKGSDINDLASKIMSSPLIKVDAGEYCFEALLSMMRSKIHHLLVVENDKFKGVVTNHDFMVLQGASPTAFAKEIEGATTAEELAGMTPKLYKAVSSLLFEGAKATNIVGLITEIGEKVILKSFEIAERELGAPPLNYSVFLYGGSGRRELTLSMNIRLGIIYEDINSSSLLAAGNKYFLKLSERVNFIMSGFCPDSRDVIKPERIKSSADWKGYFSAWKYEVRGLPEPQYFDMRHIRGDEAAVEVLREHLFVLVKGSEEIMDLMAAVTVENRPPLGFFRRFVVEKSGEHKNEFDLTMKGIRPLVDAVRIFAVEKGYRETSSIKRLQYLRDRYSFKYAEDIIYALNYLDSLLIHHQLGLIERGLEPDTFINPGKLTNIEKNTLREIFQLNTKVYDIIEKSYRTERVS